MRRPTAIRMSYYAEFNCGLRGLDGSGSITSREDRPLGGTPQLLSWGGLKSGKRVNSAALTNFRCPIVAASSLRRR